MVNKFSIDSRPLCDHRCFQPQYVILYSLQVSIHTPARGEQVSKSIKHITEVSIHTPTRGVTDFVVLTDEQRGVSIHTPTRGVTAAADDTLVAVEVSIHTPTRGVT